METDEQVAELRSFNRFYTRLIGLLDEHLLASGLTLAEARVLFEIGADHAGSARDLEAILGLDKGYLSRIVNRLERAGLFERTVPDHDRRARGIRLTGNGEARYEQLQERTNRQLSALLDVQPDWAWTHLISGMRLIRSALDGSWAESADVTIRPFRHGDPGWMVERHGVLYWAEYGWNHEFEALVAEIVAGFLRDFRERREQCWIAEVGGIRAGSIMCVQADERTAKLRLLLVEPFVRGKGVGNALVEECIQFAKGAGYEQMVLWTNSVLVEARRIYERRGFVLESTEPHHSFGHDLVSQTWRLDLLSD